MSLEELEQGIDVLAVCREVDTSKVGQLGSGQALVGAREALLETSTGKERERQSSLHIAESLEVGGEESNRMVTQVHKFLDENNKSQENPGLRGRWGGRGIVVT